MVLGALGPALGIDVDTIRVAGTAMLFAFALEMLVPALGERFSRYVLQIASAANAASTQLDGVSLLSAAAPGAVLGLVWAWARPFRWRRWPVPRAAVSCAPATGS